MDYKEGVLMEAFEQYMGGEVCVTPQEMLLVAADAVGIAGQSMELLVKSAEKHGFDWIAVEGLRLQAIMTLALEAVEEARERIEKHVVEEVVGMGGIAKECNNCPKEDGCSILEVVMGGVDGEEGGNA